MAAYSHHFTITNVTGRVATYLETQAGIADEIARKDTSATARCIVGPVTLSGSGQAHGTLTWHFVTTHHRPTYRVPYTVKRDYTEQAVWDKVKGGWQEERAQIVLDTTTYKRLIMKKDVIHRTHSAQADTARTAAATADTHFDPQAHARFGHHLSGFTAEVPIPESEAPIQRQADPETAAGLPAPLQSGVEALSGMAMDDVRVHAGSAQPAALNALAYAQGSDIQLPAGPEQHLPHEAWHVVQQ